MSREKAASVNLDGLLGLSGNYVTFQNAANALSEDDKQLLQNAVSSWLRDDAIQGTR
jgi:hypothetical protein